MRVFCFVIENPASDVSAAWDSLAGSCLHGTVVEGSDARRAVLDPDWLKAITGARMATVLIGEEWKPILPPRFRGVSVGEAGDTVAKRLSDLESYNLNEPWELLTVWLNVSDAAQVSDIRKFVNKLPPDIGTIGVLLNPHSAIRTPQWLCSAPKVPASDAGARPIEDVLVTLLGWLGVNPPKPFKGARLELSPEKTSGYSPAEEREIQKRLEDLGYL